MPPRSVCETKNYFPRSTGPNHGSRRSIAKVQKDVNRCSIRHNNCVYPAVVPPAMATAGCSPANDVKFDSTLFFVVKVRVLHGIDLYIPSKSTACRHPARPTVSVTVNDSPPQTCTAIRHARNHSIWEKHELIFQFSQEYHSRASLVHDYEHDNDILSFVSMHVSFVCTTCTCTASAHGKVSQSIAIGQVGALQIATKRNEESMVSRFFPVIRHSSLPLPAGKIKLFITARVNNFVPDDFVTQPHISPRFLFTSSTNFGAALQLKRKQLKAAVVPEEILHKSSHQTLEFDSNASLEQLEKLTIETAHAQLNACYLNIKTSHRIGEGVHSCVSLGVWMDAKDDSFQHVAVKEFRYQHASPPVTVIRAFQQEYRILERCRAQTGHAYVVNLLGVILKPRLVIVMEYFSHGSLARCLQNNLIWNLVSCKQKVFMGLEIARGIAWLHEHDMIHRDIKPHNILIGGGDLLTSSPVVKIGDLGSAVVRFQHEPLLLEEMGSSGYTAPEIFAHQGYDSKVDVWSFGIVLWELTSSTLQDRVNPFSGMTGDEFVNEAQGHSRPHLTHAHQLVVNVVIEKCWRFDPSQRPNMDNIVEMLEAIYIDLP